MKPTDKQIEARKSFNKGSQLMFIENKTKFGRPSEKARDKKMKLISNIESDKWAVSILQFMYQRTLKEGNIPEGTNFVTFCAMLNDSEI